GAKGVVKNTDVVGLSHQVGKEADVFKHPVIVNPEHRFVEIVAHISVGHEVAGTPLSAGLADCIAVADGSSAQPKDDVGREERGLERLGQGGIPSEAVTHHEKRRIGTGAQCGREIGMGDVEVGGGISHDQCSFAWLDCAQLGHDRVSEQIPFQSKHD
ncbi:MAG: hypothetical protein V3V80_05035, partial [Dehalococcoidia bacterium]